MTEAGAGSAQPKDDGSDRKRHHYVPAFYLKAFSAEEDGRRNPRVWVYEKSTGAGRLQSIKDTACEKHFYSIISEDGSRQNDLEVMFSEIEGVAKPVLDKWVQWGSEQDGDDEPDDTEHGTLATFVALLMLRVPKSLEVVREGSRVWGEEFTSRLINDDGKMREFVDANPQYTWDDVLEMRESWRNSEVSVEVHRNHVLGVSLDMMNAFTVAVLNKSMGAIRAPDGLQFITSDNPASVFLRVGPNIVKFGGVGNPLAEVWFPLSPRVGILFGDFSRYADMSLPVLVEDLNRRMLYGAYSRVFSQREHPKISEWCVEWHASRRSPGKGLLVEDEVRRSAQQGLSDEANPDALST